MALEGSVQAQITATLTKDFDLSTGASAISGNAGTRTWQIATGTGPSQGDKMFHDQRTLTDGANEDLDLRGDLLDAFGDVIEFVRVKTIYIASAGAAGAADVNTAGLKVGPASVNGFVSWVNAAVDRVRVRPQGFFSLNAEDAIAYVTTAGTADLLNIEHDSSFSDSFVYDVIIIGASA